MQKILFIVMAFLCHRSYAQSYTTTSPNGNIRLGITVAPAGELAYTVTYKNKPVMLPSTLSLSFKDPDVELRQFAVQRVDTSTHDETWQPVWGEYSQIRDHYKQLIISLKDKSGSDIAINVVFRVW